MEKARAKMDGDSLVVDVIVCATPPHAAAEALAIERSASLRRAIAANVPAGFHTVITVKTEDGTVRYRERGHGEYLS